MNKISIKPIAALAILSFIFTWCQYKRIDPTVNEPQFSMKEAIAEQLLIAEMREEAMVEQLLNLEKQVDAPESNRTAGIAAAVIGAGIVVVGILSLMKSKNSFKQNSFKPSLTPSRSKPRHEYTIGLLVLIVTFFSLGICKGRPELFEQQYTRTRLAQLFSEARWKLDSQQKYKEVRIPFSQKTGWIYVQALWAGKPVKCILDTGATYISWSKTLGLAATPTGILAQSKGIGEHRVLGEWVLVPSLELGGFKLRNIPTISNSTVEKANGQKISVAQAEGIQEIIVGNDILRNVVLTIDYQKQEVILRDRDYDITRIPRPHTYLLDLLLDNGNLVLLGQLAGHPARFQIDTGNNGMAISSSFAQKHFSASPRTRAKSEVLYGVINSDAIPSVDGNIGSIKFSTGMLSTLPLDSNVDVLIGEPFLKDFRITIDYGRSKILLEPYSKAF